MIVWNIGLVNISGAFIELSKRIGKIQLSQFNILRNLRYCISYYLHIYTRRNCWPSAGVQALQASRSSLSSSYLTSAVEHAGERERERERESCVSVGNDLVLACELLTLSPWYGAAASVAEQTRQRHITSHWWWWRWDMFLNSFNSSCTGIIATVWVKVCCLYCHWCLHLLPSLLSSANVKNTPN